VAVAKGSLRILAVENVGETFNQQVGCKHRVALGGSEGEKHAWPGVEGKGRGRVW